MSCPPWSLVIWILTLAPVITIGYYRAYRHHPKGTDRNLAIIGVNTTVIIINIAFWALLVIARITNAP